MLADQLVGEARARRPRRMDARERRVLGASALCFATVATAIALLVPSERSLDAIVCFGLVVGYALVARVRIEFGHGYAVPEQLVLVPLLLLGPLPFVPLLVAAAKVAATIPDIVRGRWSYDRWLGPPADAWFTIGPVLVLAALAPGPPQLHHAGVYALAFATQVGGDLTWSLIRDRLVDGLRVRDGIGPWAGVAQFETILTPIAFCVALVGADAPLALLSVGPVVWLLDIFSRERRERYGATLELHRAYRGTVMLLSDVVEFDDPYTAMHSRSIVDLVHAVANRLGIDSDSRQELEFAALLHDVGKIAIPKEILNKPARLTEQEFEVMKTHTIEGQFMLDRVGGLLGRVGEIVRSCHERWDGGGYPDGLEGEEIPFASRIVFACDAYNAMTTDRVYRAAMSTEEAVAELRKHSGSQFDQRVVTALIEVIEEGEPAPAPVDQVRAVLAGTSVGARDRALI